MVLKIEHRRKADYQVNPGGEGGKYLEDGGGCPPPSLSKTARPESAPCRTPLKPSLTPSRAPVQAALRLALGRAGGAAATRWARGQSYGRGVAAGRRCWGACGRGGNAKRPFEFPSMLPLCQAPLNIFSFLQSLGAVSHRPDGCGGFCGVGTSRLQRPCIRAGSHHPSPDALCVLRRELEGLWEAPPSLQRLVGKTRKCNGPPPPAPGPRPDAVPLHCFGLFACRPLWEEPRCQEALQGHEELPRHRYHPHASQALPSSTQALAPAATQGPLRLVTPPTPGPLQGHPAPMARARLGEALGSGTRATLLGCRRQAR